MTALLVLLAALLSAAPVVPTTVSLRWSAAIVSVRSEREHQRQLRVRPRRSYPERAVALAPQYPPQTFPGYSTPHFQRPPPALS